ncbi:hypothetical protein [Corynebacterium sp. AOP12-C2-36]|uniref:hypothetical protein n=1 Tax=Corynebacterium sp. AOP12-C2-36 TaxID=3457723 RepID=UPI004034BA13
MLQIDKHVSITASTDPVKQDLEITCNICEENICDIESGDSFQTLTSCVVEHLDSDRNVHVATGDL